MTRMHAPLGLRSAGDFDAMWHQLDTTSAEDAPLPRQRLSSLYHDLALPIEFIEQWDAYSLHAKLPGMVSEDVHVEVRGGVLTLQGEGPVDPVVAQGGRRTRPYAFARQFALNAPVETDAMLVMYTDGALDVRIPKKIETQMECPASSSLDEIWNARDDVSRETPDLMQATP